MTARNSADSSGFKAAAPFKGLLFAYIITSAVLVIYALLLTYTQLSDKNNAAVVLVTLALSLIAGGAFSAASAGQRGMLCGALTGILYVAVMVGLGFFLVPEYSVGTKTLVCLLLGIASGGLGGVIGVNIRRR